MLYSAPITACGVCSTAQDLASYMKNPDLAAISLGCIFGYLLSLQGRPPDAVEFVTFVSSCLQNQAGLSPVSANFRSNWLNLPERMLNSSSSC